MKCSSCGHVNAQDARFCSSCGRPLTAATDGGALSGLADDPDSSHDGWQRPEDLTTGEIPTAGPAHVTDRVAATPADRDTTPVAGIAVPAGFFGGEGDDDQWGGYGRRSPGSGPSAGAIAALVFVILALAAGAVLLAAALVDGDQPSDTVPDSVPDTGVSTTLLDDAPTTVAAPVPVTTAASEGGAPPPTPAPTSPATTVDTTPAPTEAPAPETTAAPDGGVITIPADITIGAPLASPGVGADPIAAGRATGDPTCVSDLGRRARIALIVWPAVYPSDWAAAVATVRSSGVGGVLLMQPRDWSDSELTANLADLEVASRHGLVIATDEEGGDVQRLEQLGELPSQRAMSRDATASEAEQHIAEHGRRLRSVGVDMVFGPVVDVAPPDGATPLQSSRFFRGDPSNVASYAAAYLDGWASADVFATLKHYPGHGAASADTHDAVGVTPSIAELEAWDLAPYRELADSVASTSAAVMIGHLTVPGLTDGAPATASSEAIDYLRSDLGYGDALLVTDALGMDAVGLAEPEASVAALRAGIDVVLFTRTSQTVAVIDAIDDAIDAGEVSEAHVTDASAKVMAMLGRDGHTCDRPSLAV